MLSVAGGPEGGSAGSPAFLLFAFGTFASFCSFSLDDLFLRFPDFFQLAEIMLGRERGGTLRRFVAASFADPLATINLFLYAPV
jgi:hypothetical protein